jgi:hypothetical protein
MASGTSHASTTFDTSASIDLNVVVSGDVAWDSSPSFLHNAQAYLDGTWNSGGYGDGWTGGEISVTDDAVVYAINTSGLIQTSAHANADGLSSFDADASGTVTYHYYFKPTAAGPITFSANYTLSQSFVVGSSGVFARGYSYAQLGVLDGSYLFLDAADTRTGSDFTGLLSVTADSLVPNQWYGLQYIVYSNAEALSTPVPIPGAVWLLGTALIGMVGIRRKINLK